MKLAQKISLALAALMVLVLVGANIPQDSAIAQYSGAAPTVTMDSTSQTGTLTVYESIEGGNDIMVQLNWTSDSSGDAGATIKNLQGTLLMVVYAPIASASPSASYDVTAISGNNTGIDLLDGTGANLSATAAAKFSPQVASSQTGSASKPAVATCIPITGTTKFIVDNAGASNQGIIQLFIRKG